MQDNSASRPRCAFLLLKVGQALETTLPGVFAAGDAVLGPASVIHAVAQGHKVALAVEQWLTSKLERIVYTDPGGTIFRWHVNLANYAQSLRPVPRALPSEWRSWSGFTEIEMGFDETMAQEEAKRCLRCDLEWLERIGEPIPQPEKVVV